MSNFKRSGYDDIPVNKQLLKDTIKLLDSLSVSSEDYLANEAEDLASKLDDCLQRSKTAALRSVKAKPVPKRIPEGIKKIIRQYKLSGPEEIKPRMMTMYEDFWDSGEDLTVHVTINRVSNNEIRYTEELIDASNYEEVRNLVYRF